MANTSTALTTDHIDHCWDAILVQLELVEDAGTLDRADVRTFSDLHDTFDANEFLLETAKAFDVDIFEERGDHGPSYEWANALTTAVTARLQRGDHLNPAP